ncbi:hypothetical protein MTO96_038209 [Rhipicephalus appendiculatus]
MKPVLWFAFVNSALLYFLWAGHHNSGNVNASECEHDRKKFLRVLADSHNASVRDAKKIYGSGPKYFAECDAQHVGHQCSPNCACGVLDVVTPPIYLCFETGRVLPMGFKF